MRRFSGKRVRIGRVKYLKSCAIFNVLAFLWVANLAWATSEEQSMLVGFVGPKNSSGWRGATLGVSEANRQGRYFGKHLTLEHIADPDAVTTSLLIVAAESSAVQKMASADRVVISIISSDDELRSACLSGLFFTNPSDRMLMDVLKRWQERNPGSYARPLAWHSSFLKYAARDLNKRYRARFNEPMKSEAWAGWVAARVFGDALILGGVNTPQGAVDFFRDKLSFDGQKGTALSFRSDGQLRQVILLVDNDTVVGEVPRGKSTATILSRSIGNKCSEGK